jgi:hypothetical protein
MMMIKQNTVMMMTMMTMIPLTMVVVMLMLTANFGDCESFYMHA